MSSSAILDPVEVAGPVDSDVVIRVENLSKCYQIYDKPQHRLWQGLLRGRKQFFREFWALKDVSFEVRRGETVGIIGRNGSGKSTLLQMICGTLTQTAGSIDMRGRVAALLELGAGFSPEFSGRENLTMNAAILGLSPAEILARADEVVRFADIGEFIDQPVKTYSSGMYVRLAFAIAINVNPDILVIDEALAVGDAYFQAKCFERLKDLQRRGTTVLFVSHDSAAVKSLCSKAYMLEHGKVVAAGGTEEVLERYLKNTLFGNSVPRLKLFESEQRRKARMSASLSTLAADFEGRGVFDREGNGRAQFLSVRVLHQSGDPVRLVDFGQRLTLEMIVEARDVIPKLLFAYHIRDRNGLDVVYSDSGIEDRYLFNLEPGAKILIEWTFDVALRDGDYSVVAVLSVPKSLDIGQVEFCDYVPIAAQFTVTRRPGAPLHGCVHWHNEIGVTALA